MEDPYVVHVAASGQKRDCTRSTSAGQIVDKEFRTKKQIVEGNTSTARIMGESLLQESLLQVLHSDGTLSCHSQTIPHNSLVHVAEGNNFGRSSSHSLCSSRITAQEKKLKNKSSHTLLLMQEQSSLEC